VLVHWYAAALGNGVVLDAAHRELVALVIQEPPVLGISLSCGREEPLVNLWQ